METFPGRVPFSKDESFTPLRAPHTVPMQSTLSVNAQEFVPTRTNDRQTSAAPQQQNFYPRPHYQRNNHHHNHHQQQQHYQQNGYQRMSHHHNQQQHNQQQNQFQQRMSTLANDVQDRLKIKSGHGGAANNRGNSGNFYSNQRPSTSHQHHQHHHQQQHQNHQHANSSSHYKNNKDHGGNPNSSRDLENIALDYLTTVIQCLNRNPGQFDSIATRFLTLFDGLENSNYALSIAMEDIFKESTQNSNFRYMGAKLFNLLHMINLRKDSLFLSLLKCKLDFHQKEVQEYMRQNEHAKVRETALFLAELYMQLRGDDSRIQLLAENIVYSLKQLLGSESADNMRCICLTLKLAGFDLTNDCPNDVNEIISALAGIEASAPGKYPIVASVLALQRENWGRKLSLSVSLTESEGLPEPPRASDDPIFYGPDGRELTAEETDFLSCDAPADNGGSSDDDDDDELDLEMDEDAAKAYKEFCKLNKAS